MGQRGAPPGRTRSNKVRNSGSASERLSSAVAESAGDSGTAWKRRQLVAVSTTALTSAATAQEFRRSNPVTGAPSTSTPAWSNHHEGAMKRGREPEAQEACQGGRPVGLRGLRRHVADV